MATATLFGNIVPDVPDVGADNPVTLATIIPINKDCELTAIRFYKHANNTGPHVGAVWELDNGTPLATVTFTGETAEGWQEQVLDAPVQLTAGTIYIIGVHMPNGHWSYSPAAVPWTIGSTDENTPITFGTRFIASEQVTVKGVAFAIGEQGWETTTLTAKLWSNGGDELAAGTLAGVAPRTSGGSHDRWAYVLFDAPVLIDEDTPYVVSVHMPEGVYVPNGGWFADQDRGRDIITALQTGGVHGDNGVFAYTSDVDEFPTGSFNGGFYGVEPILDDYLFTLAGEGVSHAGYAYSNVIEYPGPGLTNFKYPIDGVFEFDDGAGQIVSVTGVGSAEAFGTPALVQSLPQAISPAGIASQAAFGKCVLDGGVPQSEEAGLFTAVFKSVFQPLWKEV